MISKILSALRSAKEATCNFFVNAYNYVRNIFASKEAVEESETVAEEGTTEVNEEAETEEAEATVNMVQKASTLLNKLGVKSLGLGLGIFAAVCGFVLAVRKWFRTKKANQAAKAETVETKSNDSDASVNGSDAANDDDRAEPTIETKEEVKDDVKEEVKPSFIKRHLKIVQSVIAVVCFAFAFTLQYLLRGKPVEEETETTEAPADEVVAA